MCSEKYNYYMRKPFSPHLNRVYYKVNKKTKEIRVFSRMKREWVRAKLNYNQLTLFITSKDIKPITPPDTPYSCNWCKNKGCKSCKPLPWSICNVFRRT